MAIQKVVSTAYEIEAAAGDDEGNAGTDTVTVAFVNGANGLTIQIGDSTAAVFRDEEARELPKLLSKLNRESGRTEAIKRPRKAK